jgi:hypothetical protein
MKEELKRVDQINLPPAQWERQEQQERRTKMEQVVLWVVEQL